MYFKYLPSIDYPYYNIDEKLIKKASKNIFSRVKFSEYVKTYKTNFDEYTIRDSERPDTLSYRLYERPDLHWMFFLINEMINPYYSWPLSTKDLQSYIDDKYPGASFFAPKIWKNSSQDLFLGSLSSVNNETSFTEIEISLDLIDVLVPNSPVKVSLDGEFFETVVLDKRDKFYELSLEKKSWDLTNATNKYLYYEIDYFGEPACLKIPITRTIDFKKYSVNQFQYNDEYRDPSMTFEKGVFSLEENPYNFYPFPFNTENLTNGNFANYSPDTESFADVFAIANNDGEYMDASYYKTNEEYELEINESKRNILIPKPQLVEEILKQIKEIFLG